METAKSTLAAPWVPVMGAALLGAGVAAGARAALKRLRRRLHARLHAHAVGDVAAELAVEVDNEFGRRLARAHYAGKVVVEQGLVRQRLQVGLELARQHRLVGKRI